MSDSRVIGQTKSIGRVAQGANVRALGTLEGITYTVDRGLALATTGEIFVANGGSASDPATFAGLFDADGPDFVIDVPALTTIVPLWIQVHLESVGTTALNEVFASVSKTLGAVTAITGGALVTPVNLRTGNSSASGCTVNVAVDAAGATAQTGSIYEFMRNGFQLAEDMAATEPGWPEKNWQWSAKQMGIYPVLDGPASLFIHAGCTTPTGFITVIYAEALTTEI